MQWQRYWTNNSAERDIGQTTALSVHRPNSSLALTLRCECKVNKIWPLWPIPALKKTFVDRSAVLTATRVLFSQIRNGFLDKLVVYIYTNSNVIVNDDQQVATILAYLFIPNQFYIFRAMSSPIIRST